MPQTQKRLAQLLEKSNSLPTCPGVYIMKDKAGRVIYVGKSKKLKSRVSQYFQNSKKNSKTIQMVNTAEDFDYIVCKTEIEALSLENLLIKQHTPKYNIKLKDAKSYPYIKITNSDYPKILFTRTRSADKGKYYGPFSGSAIAYSILDILHKNLGIPNCKLKFPQDIGKTRPCIYYQMNQCCGVCTGNVAKEEYNKLISCATDILKGNISVATESMQEQMIAMANAENFEAAAKFRDTIRALERLKQKQNVVASPDVNMDVFGFYSQGPINCMSVIYVRNGAVTDMADYVFNSDAITDSDALLSFITEHYIQRDSIPQEIVISFDMEDEDAEMLKTFLEKRLNKKVVIKKPLKGKNKELVDIAIGNAKEKARQAKITAEKSENLLVKLSQLLKLEFVPQRIEAFDISNIGSENVTAGMVVYTDGKPLRADYRLFKMKTLQGGVDDYSSMKEAIRRRIRRLKEDKSGSFAKYPDLLLIDGGKGHVSAVKEVLDEESIDIAVFGMVKDEYHKTRALCTDSEEINIARERDIFMFIYGIQEEVHRFTVNTVNSAKRKTLKRSSLENIVGIGPNKAKNLLSSFGTLSNLKGATIDEIAAVKGISKKDAQNIVEYFQSKRR